MTTSPVDTRFDLAVAAAAHERRARPRYLLLLALAALVVASIAALMSLASLAGARERVQNQRAQAGLVRDLVDELRRLEARSRGVNPQAELHARNPNIVSSLETAATRAGLTTPPRRPTTRSEDSGNITDHYYRYTGVRDHPEALMRWLEVALTEIPGLELWSITLEPAAADWKLDVEFRRWEFKP